ncbi:glycosyltransferase [Aquimarina litoralis]|uniref:glycosyltransferase n=1 Tax=Aquimarina litoralis TaxID=584605 RepID=UPI001C562C73|nr:glycosyltransferase [Aquimarina litoralis]MBW1294942.1 glycosyltransferase [Aquimarina litoralis]
MKILLVGEYSRLHNSLKEGLIQNGHDVTIVGHGDLFKKYPVDINIDGSFVKNSFLLNKIRHLIYLLTSIDIASIETTIKFKRNKKLLKDYDFVQLINETPFNIGPYFEKKLLKFLFKNNKNVYLLACGDDYRYISYSLQGKFPYSTLSPLLKDPSLKEKYRYTLKSVSNKQKKMHDFIFKYIKGVIPGSVEYKIAYQNTSKVLPMIPNPVNIDIIKTQTFDTKKIKILHGINTSNYLKKGNQYFEEALKVIADKYQDRIEIVTTKDLPYKEYITHFQSAHILLDQAQAHDQGYNALEAMAMGKVVFTGAGESFRKHYNLKDRIVAIDTYPDSSKIAKNLEQLILNPDKIKEIGKNARKFIEEEHNYIKVAKRYVATWQENTGFKE